MEDCYNDGFNDDYGKPWRNKGHESPEYYQGCYTYERGLEDGKMQREISKELDQE